MQVDDLILVSVDDHVVEPPDLFEGRLSKKDRKSTRLNSSHSQISYAVFCLKKKKSNEHPLGLRSAVSTHLDDCSIRCDASSSLCHSFRLCLSIVLGSSTAQHAG